jgi:hypothetical protein
VPFSGGARHQVSTDGGEQAMWSPKGDELFYRAGDRMMAVTVSAHGSSFEAARPHELFRGRYVSSDLAGYDVSRDAMRFLMVRPSEDELRPAEISVGADRGARRTPRAVGGNTVLAGLVARALGR